MDMTNQHPNDNNPITIILFCIANLFGAIGLTMSELDLLLAIFLKIVSIGSFSIMIVINYPKLKEVVKKYFKKK